MSNTERTACARPAAVRLTSWRHALPWAVVHIWDGEPGERMKFAPMAILPMTALLLLAAGCSSTVASISPAKYDRMSCQELNVALGDAATDISRTAISRGKVASTSVPTWLLGGERVKTVVANRETTRIERLQQQQQTLIAARKSRCASSQ